MLLKFISEETQSYDEGMAKPFLKENQPFEVSDGEGQRLLKVTSKQSVEGEIKTVNVFEVFSEKIKESLLPENFPAREILSKNKILTFEQVSALDTETLLKINGVGKGFAEQILSEVERIKAEQPAI